MEDENYNEPLVDINYKPKLTLACMDFWKQACGMPQGYERQRQDAAMQGRILGAALLGGAQAQRLCPVCGAFHKGDHNR